MEQYNTSFYVSIEKIDKLITKDILDVPKHNVYHKLVQLERLLEIHLKEIKNRREALCIK